MKNHFNPHLLIKHHHPLSICPKPHRTRMCSILLFLHNLLPQDHHQKKFPQDFKHQLLSHCPYFHLFYSSQYLLPGYPRKRPFIKHWDSFKLIRLIKLLKLIKMIIIFKLCILLINLILVTQEKYVCTGEKAFH